MKIAIDTEELHGLARAYRDIAEDLRRRSSALRAVAFEVPLNYKDDAIRGANVPNRLAEKSQQIDALAGDLEAHSVSVDRIAVVMDLDQAGGSDISLGAIDATTPSDWASRAAFGALGFAPLFLGRSIARSDRGEWYADGIGAVLAGTGTGVSATWRAGTNTLRHTFENLEQGALSVETAATHFGDRLAHIAQDAWHQTADDAHAAYRTIVNGIEHCVDVAAGAFTSSLHSLRTVGHFVADSASFTWDLIKSLPGNAIEAFKKLWHALVDLPVWKYVTMFVNWTENARTWVAHKGLDAAVYLFGPPLPFTPPDVPPTKLGKDVEVQKVESVEIGAEVTVLLGFKPKIGITKTYYSDGTVDVTFEEEGEIDFEVGLGGGAKAGDASAKAEAKAGGGVKGKHKMTWRFPGPDGERKANEFIAAAKQRYIRELSRWAALMMIPFGSYIAMGSGAPSLIGDGTSLWGSPISESWTGGIDGKASAQTAGGPEKAKAEYSDDKDVTLNNDKITGDHTLAAEITQSIEGGAYGPLSASVGASLSFEASITTDRDWRPKSLGIEAEGMLSATAAAKVFGVKAKSGAIYKFKISGDVPLEGHLRELAERAVRDRSPEAMNELVKAAGSEVKLKVTWGVETSDNFEVGAEGKVGVKVGAGVSYKQSSYVQQGQTEMTAAELARLL